jgi:hypothetical protein
MVTPTCRQDRTGGGMYHAYERSGNTSLVAVNMLFILDPGEGSVELVQNNKNKALKIVFVFLQLLSGFQRY